MSKTTIKTRLFLIANLSIFMIGLGFAVRATIASDLQANIFSILDLANSTSMVGEALGITFTGFAFTLLFGSAIVDFIGAKRMLIFSACCYLFGSLLTIFASFQEVTWAVYYQVLIGLLLTGLGWGAVEAATNPMVAGLDSENKVARLNILHAWWPAGIVVGGLFGYAFGIFDAPWQINLLLLIIPAGIMIYLILGTEFPESERIKSGVSYLDMCRELYRKPQFILFWFCMWLTASTELAPGQWVDLTLSRVVGIDGIIILVYISVLMFVMRHFAGDLAKRISTIGLLWFSSLFAAVGLYMLSLATSPLSAFSAATVWGVGVCFMWPTMLAVVSERFPKGGALFLGLLGFAGGMAIQFLLPVLGRIFDDAKIEAAGGISQLAVMTEAQMNDILIYASVESFQTIAYIPVVLLPIFGAIWVYDSRTKSLNSKGIE